MIRHKKLANYFSSLLALTQEVYIFLSRSWVITDFSKTAEHFFSWDRNKIIGQSMESLYKKRGIHMPFSQEIFNALINCEITETIVKDSIEQNEKIDLLWSLVNLNTLESTAEGFVLIGRDPFFKRTFEGHIAVETQRLEQIAACVPGNFYWKNIHSEYLGCNQALLDMLGLSSMNDIVGKTDYDLWPEQARELRRHDQQVIKSGKTIYTEETINIPGKETMFFTVIKMPFFDRAGRIIGILGNSLNITELKKIQNDLKIAKEKAETANQAKSEFLRNMEHQLRTPFSGVYSLVQMLADQEMDPEKKQLLEITYSSGKELLDFLNDVISFSRNQVEATAILAKKFDLKQLIDRAITLEKPAAVMKGLNLSFNYPDDLPSIFISDPKRVQRIVLNLLSNAIKFTPKGSVSITVNLGKKIDEKNYILRIIVADTGIGIAEADQSLIYEKFYRVFPANQNKYQGAGLGLHIVKELITDLEGEIDLHSQLNEGSTFICTLPFKRPLIDEIIADEDPPKRKGGYLNRPDLN